MKPGVHVCSICQAPKPPHFLVCASCWREVPWPMKVIYWGCKGHHHHRPQEWETRFTHAMSNILSHLKQFSSAIP